MPLLIWWAVLSYKTGPYQSWHPCCGTRFLSREPQSHLNSICFFGGSTEGNLVIRWFVLRLSICCGFLALQFPSECHSVALSYNSDVKRILIATTPALGLSPLCGLHRTWGETYLHAFSSHASQNHDSWATTKGSPIQMSWWEAVLLGWLWGKCLIYIFFCYIPVDFEMDLQ